MAKELYVTPLAEVRWCKLVGNARPNTFDPGKPNQWTAELVLDNANKTHSAWLVEMEDQYETLHGSKKKHKAAFPWAPDKEDDTKTVVRFKLNEFKRKDGSVSEGPTIFDSRKNPWPADKEIGNGSKVIVAFSIYAWEGPTGCGLTFQPLKAQVVDLVEYERKGGAEVFDVIPGGYVDPEMPF
jgi:hypothetical protein